MNDLQSKARKLAEHLNSIGYNIETVIAYTKGQKVLFKKVQEDMIFISQYFGREWASGVQLKFKVIDSKLIFLGKGAFGFHNDEYDTTVNNNVLTNLIQIVEKYSI